MKLASKFIAALAVMASFSSFAADIVVTDDYSTTGTDFDTAAALPGDGSSSYAGILQGVDSIAIITQVGVNAALIFQASSESAGSISQNGSGNVGVIYQSVDGSRAAIVQIGEGSKATISQQ